MKSDSQFGPHTVDFCFSLEKVASSINQYLLENEKKLEEGGKAPNAENGKIGTKLKELTTC